MIVFRKRLLYWLLKEYTKKWGKTIIFFFLIGLVFFFGLRTILGVVSPKLPLRNTEIVGIVGAYTADTLPDYILQDVSQGLTSVANDGSITPGIAKSWKIEDNGKKYTFVLNDALRFTDGRKLTSYDLIYDFSDAKVERPNASTIRFLLKDTYSPFLVSISQPVFKKNFVGVGPYKVKYIKLNGNFIQSIDLVLAKNPFVTKTYRFYPTSDSLKTAFLLGEVNETPRLYDDTFRNISFEKFPNVTVQKTINYDQLVTLFYNTQDKYLSSRDIRNGLTYALPDSFTNGRRAFIFLPPTLWAYAPQYLFAQDTKNAKLLTQDLNGKTASESAVLEIKTLPKYKSTALEVQKAWSTIGVKSEIIIVDTVPSNFQVFLGDFTLPRDPDQYVLWHSGQENNITKYENKRIDKLLEDGRKTLDLDERKKIYEDLQKYLLADSPAAFLYFPYEYTLKRK